MRNWKTTFSGIASILGGVAMFLNHPDQMESAIGMVVVGLGLLFAKDHNVTGTNKEQSESIFGGRPDDRR